ncbi:MAG: hypothetical protein KIT36_17610 [Alphaproteobacteria bacterium]|nr:hypothetical protein [Alphaproteobacteria bacterium]
MKIDRTKAIGYARTHWNRPCDDGVFWITNDVINVAKKRVELKAPASDGWEAMFVSGGSAPGSDPEQAVFRRTVGGVVQTKLIQGWAGLADCAHYLSRCLQAGGIDVNERGVASLVNTLQARRDTKTLAEKVSKDRGQRVVNSGIFKEGDMIGYFNVDPDGDYGRAQSYTHSTMYAGKLDAADPGRVTCHTVARFPGLSWVNDEWSLHDGYTYTFIHFGDDDPPLSATTATALPGWWKVVYGTRTEFYYIYKDGRARYTLKAPTSNRELYAPEGTAYWFQGTGTITFIWRKSGTVETWTATADTREYRISVNGTPGTSTKMF